MQVSKDEAKEDKEWIDSGKKRKERGINFGRN